MFDTTKEVYTHRKEKRRDYESKTNTKSILSKTEIYKKASKRGAGYFKKTLKGEPVD
ncbi:hypothetical protein [Aliarcobacter butzleri]|uniref:hypothetical protein n=1 Tax=Aliarcobacter butzleri TaxID=28197 RepID=UPI00189D749C|nr:hypothetical protein [Aliarcobacter butzleri]MDN5130162.1 hypothetical protein [Aliarcobacter butzleri]